MKQDAIHRLQGAGIATVALLGAAYVSAASHDARISTRNSEVVGIGQLSLNSHRTAQPVIVRENGNGIARIAVIVNDRKAEGGILPPGWPFSSAPLEPTSASPLEVAFRKGGVLREIATVDRRAATMQVTGIEAASSPGGVALARSGQQPRDPEPVNRDLIPSLCGRAKPQG